MAAGLALLVLTYWAVHRFEWAGPLVANSLRAVVGVDNVAHLEDLVYEAEDRVNRFTRKNEKPQAYWQVPAVASGAPGAPAASVASAASGEAPSLPPFAPDPLAPPDQRAPPAPAAAPGPPAAPPSSITSATMAVTFVVPMSRPTM